MRKRKEADDRDDPRPEEYIDGIGRHAPSHAAPNLIKTATEHDAAPGKHRKRDNLNVEPPPGLVNVQRTAKQPQVLVQEVPFDEGAVKPPEHVQEPWRRDGENHHKAASE